MMNNPLIKKVRISLWALGIALCLAGLQAPPANAQSCTPVLTGGGIGYNTWTSLTADYNNVDYVSVDYYGHAFIIYKDGANVRLSGADSDGAVGVNLTTSTTSVTHQAGESSFFDASFRLSGTAVQARTYYNDNFSYHTYKGCGGGSGDNLGNHTATQAVNMGGFAINNASGYFHTSDAALKANISKLSGWEILKHITGYSYDWKNGGGKSAGVLAQEVEKVLPSAVATDKTTGAKSVEYDQLIAPIIESIRELNGKVDALESENRALREEVKTLKQE